jgi:hypothetical protein
MAALAAATPPPKIPPLSPLRFGWVGKWTGTLVITPADGEPKSIAMELELAPLSGDKYTWRLVYDDAGKRQVREYELVPKPDKPGRFEIDEKNGIRLGVTLTGNTLFSLFQVGESLIQSRYELAGDVLKVEMTAYSTKDPLSTKAGGGVEVKSPRLMSVQRAELKRAAP